MKKKKDNQGSKQRNNISLESNKTLRTTTEERTTAPSGKHAPTLTQTREIPGKALHTIQSRKKKTKNDRNQRQINLHFHIKYPRNIHTHITNEPL